MADLTSHPEFDLDTALSADVDGELAAYAADLGVPVDDLRAAIATPTAAARRAELDEVRRRLGATESPALDELTRRRLLTGAGVGARDDRPRDRGWLLRAGAAAAVTLVIVGALYAIITNSGGSGETAIKGAGGGSTAAAAVTGDLGDLGTVDAAGVSRLLRGDRAVPSAPENSAKRADTAAGSSTAAPTFGPATVDACASQYASLGSVRFRGQGTYGGTPAVVLGIDTDRRTIVFVVAAADCTQVLYSASR